MCSILPKRILCIDMDSFFASVEMATRPELRKVPMAVIGSGERTIVLSASYSARMKGVHTGQTIQEAMQKCSKIQFVRASNKKYAYVSSLIAEYLQSMFPSARMYSVDEAFIDITDSADSSQDIAFRLKTWLKTNLKITGSIGVGQSYILAKMASNVNKPDGFYEVLPDDSTIFVDSFKLKDIWGIGRKTVEKLHNLGLYTPADVRAYGADKLFSMYGIPGQSIYNACYGMDKESAVDKNAPLKSISHAITAPEDVCSVDIVNAYLLQLSETVSRRARMRMYSGKAVNLTVREPGMSTYSFRKNLGFYTSATHHIYEAVKGLFVLNVPRNTPVRLLGVGIDNLLHGGTTFTNIEEMISGDGERFSNLYKVIDDINGKYTNGVVHGSVLKVEYREPKGISFSFKKDTFWRSVYNPSQANESSEDKANSDREQIAVD